MRYKGETFTMYGKTVKQVNKSTAEKLFNQGETLFLLPCNMRVNNMWQSPCPMNKEQSSWGDTFKSMVNSFRYYNCDKERGLYPIFFAEVK